MKKLIVATIVLYCGLLLCGCSMYDKEYVSISDYTYPLQNAAVNNSAKTASNLTELKSAIVSIVDSGEEEGQIVISDFYNGNINEDMDNAIWQVKSQDALCAYCVKNISYDLITIVTYNEVNLHVTYSNIGLPLGNILKLQYSTDLGEIVETSINNTDKKLVILVNKSSFSSNDMMNLIDETYNQNPLICPVRPKATVALFSGNNGQRLYEITFNYRMSDELLKEQKDQLNNISLFTEEEIAADEFEKVCTVVNRLSTIIPGEGNTVHDALVKGCADSEGIALGFVALCREIGLESLIVYGQQNLEECCWNMVKIDGNYYHVDVSSNDGELLKTDEQMWGTYRWNTYEYPVCDTPYLID